MSKFTFAGAILTGLLFASNLSAGDFPRGAFYGSLIGADGVTTEVFYRLPETPSGYRLWESNPLTAAMPGTPGRIALWSAETYGLMKLDKHLEKRGHKGWLKALRIGTGVVQGWAVGSNLYNIRKWQKESRRTPASGSAGEVGSLR